MPATRNCKYYMVQQTYWFM